MDDLPTLRIGGVPEHYNLPWHLYLESDAAAELPLALEWIDTPGGTGEMVAMLASGELELAVTLMEGAVKAIAAGSPSVLLRTYVASPLQWGVHVPATSDLNSMADLAGHRFAISRLGSGSHLMAHVLADDLGFVAGDDNFVQVGGLEGARKALGGGEAEIFLWDRSMTSPYVEAGEFRRVGVIQTPWPAFVVVAHTEVADEYAEAITSLLDDVADAAQALVANPDRVDLVAERYGLDPAEVTAWFDETEWDCAKPMDADVVATIQDRLVALDLITEPIPINRYLGRPVM
jgi:ABC-type nitrate/sulfonate/bicarbonate transport system substrate-binding protein